MSCLESICVCSDDDLTTSLMFKFCIADAEDEYQFVNKYQYRLFISMVFDCIFFPLLVLGADKFQMETFGMVLSFILFGIALMAHIICLCKLQRLKFINPGKQSCLIFVSKVSLIIECISVFICSFTRCMVVDIVEYTYQEHSCIQAEVLFRSFNFYSGSLAYAGYCVGLFSITTSDKNGKLVQSPFFYIVVIWMALDLLRLSWFCIKSIKKQQALIEFESDPKYIKPQHKGGKYVYTKPQELMAQPEP